MRDHGASLGRKLLRHHTSRKPSSTDRTKRRRQRGENSAPREQLRPHHLFHRRFSLTSIRNFPKSVPPQAFSCLVAGSWNYRQLTVCIWLVCRNGINCRTAPSN